MKQTLYTLLEAKLGTQSSIALSIGELEKIAGDDWLLEVNEQALKLNARAEPHQQDPSLVLIVRG